MSSEDRILQARDGTRIAYSVEGSGPPLVLTNGLTTSTSFWKYLRPIWLQKHTVIMWDLPGHGASEPARTPVTARVETQPSFIAGIMDSLRIERAAQIGWSTGCQVVLELYRQFPERCSSLSVLFGPAGHVLDTTRLPVPGAMIERLVRGMPERMFALTCRLLAAAMRAPGHRVLGRQLQLIGEQVSAEDMLEMVSSIGSVDPSSLKTLLLSLQEHSAHALLSSLTVPLLIVAGDTDIFAPTHLVGAPMHAAAPGSELVRLPNGMHTALLEEPAVIAAAVEAFLARGGDPRRVRGRGSRS